MVLNIKIIALEGLDKSGTFSQTGLLQNKLQSLGYKVQNGEFHNYASPTGKLIMDWLTNKWDVDQTTIELIMAADKQTSQTWFKKLEDKGIDFLILDRYTLSQIVYGLASGSDERWISSLQKYMRKPDIDIVIDIPAEVSMRRKGKHNNGENDRYESDVKMLQEVREIYKYISTEYSAPVKEVVNGERSIHDVHDEIFKIVKENFLHSGERTTGGFIVGD